jgi:hypothetical protein
MILGYASEGFAPEAVHAAFWPALLRTAAHAGECTPHAARHLTIDRLVLPGGAGAFERRMGNLWTGCEVNWRALIAACAEPELVSPRNFGLALSAIASYVFGLLNVVGDATDILLGRDGASEAAAATAVLRDWRNPTCALAKLFRLGVHGALLELRARAACVTWREGEAEPSAPRTFVCGRLDALLCVLHDLLPSSIKRAPRAPRAQLLQPYVAALKLLHRQARIEPILSLFLSGDGSHDRDDAVPAAPAALRPVTLQFQFPQDRNTSTEAVLLRLKPDGQEEEYALLHAGGEQETVHTQDTYAGHWWRVSDAVSQETPLDYRATGVEMQRVVISDDGPDEDFVGRENAEGGFAEADDEEEDDSEARVGVARALAAVLEHDPSQSHIVAWRRVLTLGRHSLKLAAEAGWAAPSFAHAHALQVVSEGHREAAVTVLLAHLLCKAHEGRGMDALIRSCGSAAGMVELCVSFRRYLRALRGCVAAMPPRAPRVPPSGEQQPQDQEEGEIVNILILATI